MDELKTQLRDYIVDNFLFGDVDVEFSETDSLMEKGIVDSTGVLEIISYIEQEFNIKIEDKEILPENLDSLDNISNFIAKKK